MSDLNKLALLGFASGVAANEFGCALGPWYMYHHPHLFHVLNMNIEWHAMLKTTTTEPGQAILPLVEKNTSDLGLALLPLAENRLPFCVIGGDHSCAIGTWSAVAHANRQHGDIGLVWIDAHLDAHTPNTSITQNIHGMPVAILLGEGPLSLCQLFDELPKIKPENMYLIGVRSYQEAEVDLLARLGVTVFFMHEVQQRGIGVVLAEACARAAQTTCGFGISIDMDAIDPVDAPGVGCPEPVGINGAALVCALQDVDKELLLGLEIAEYNPLYDQQGKTAVLLVDLIHAVYEDTCK